MYVNSIKSNSFVFRSIKKVSKPIVEPIRKNFNSKDLLISNATAISGAYLVNKLIQKNIEAENVKPKKPDFKEKLTPEMAQLYDKLINEYGCKKLEAQMHINVLKNKEGAVFDACKNRIINDLKRIKSVRDDKQFSELLKEKVIKENDIKTISYLQDNQVQEFKALLKSNAFKELLKEGNFPYHYDIFNAGIDFKDYIESYPSFFKPKVFDDFKKGINYIDAVNINHNEEIGQIYNSLVADGYDEKTASVLANIDGIKDKGVVEVNNLMKKIGNDGNMSVLLSNYFNSDRNKNLDVSDLNKYCEKFDFNYLSDIAPQIKNYTPAQKLKFIDFYYGEQETNFSKDKLKLNSDFTDYLASNYLNADDLNDLLTVKPLTSREVGTLPKGWTDNKSNIDKAKIYSVIDSFRQNGNIDDFSKQMSNILGRPVQVIKLGSGCFGTGYKISMLGSEDVCLKIFNNNDLANFKNIHGQHIETQTGLFVNKHSNDFVKMYFGKVSADNNNDGFLVTQFLSNDIKPLVSDKIEEGYNITSNDAFGDHNIINGKIIDYGAVVVNKK